MMSALSRMGGVTWNVTSSALTAGVKIVGAGLAAAGEQLVYESQQAQPSTNTKARKETAIDELPKTDPLFKYEQIDHALEDRVQNKPSAFFVREKNRYTAQLEKNNIVIFPALEDGRVLVITKDPKKKDVCQFHIIDPQNGTMETRAFTPKKSFERTANEFMVDTVKSLTTIAVGGVNVTSILNWGVDNYLLPKRKEYKTEHDMARDLLLEMQAATKEEDKVKVLDGMFASEQSRLIGKIEIPVREDEPSADVIQRLLLVKQNQESPDIDLDAIKEKYQTKRDNFFVKDAVKKAHQELSEKFEKFTDGEKRVLSFFENHKEVEELIDDHKWSVFDAGKASVAQHASHIGWQSLSWMTSLGNCAPNVLSNWLKPKPKEENLQKLISKAKQGDIIPLSMGMNKDHYVVLEKNPDEEIIFKLSIINSEGEVRHFAPTEFMLNRLVRGMVNMKIALQDRKNLNIDNIIQELRNHIQEDFTPIVTNADQEGDEFLEAYDTDKIRNKAASSLQHTETEILQRTYTSKYFEPEM